MIAITSERSLRRRQDPGDARVVARGLRERAADRLEHGLRDVVQVVAVVHGDVQRDLRVERERAEELLQEVAVEIGDAAARHRHAEDEERPPRDVHRGGDEGLVHRDRRGAEAHDALLVAERLFDRLTEHDADVLDRVVLIDLDVALCLDGEVHEPVLGERLQHVAEERDRRLDLRGAGAVEPQRERDLRLLRLALHARLPSLAHVRSPSFVRASAALPWAVSPSMRDSVVRCGSAAASPDGEYSSTLERFTKSSVPSGDAKRAVPAVGRTWFGPGRAVGSAWACAGGSAAIESGAAAASATTTTSLGPAIMSMPTSPNTRILARAT